MELRAADAGDPAWPRPTGQGREQLANELFSDRFLIRRALLQAIDPAQPVPPVLLIDELDRADEPFEAFLLEVLSDFQITIPEFGTVKAIEPPIVVLTSNRTREIHDAVKRRCLYHWVGFPDATRELAILERRVPGAPKKLPPQIVAFVQRLRDIELYKLPGIAETIEWTRALMELDAMVLDPQVIKDTLGVLLKYQDDIGKVQGARPRACSSRCNARRRVSAMGTFRSGFGTLRTVGSSTLALVRLWRGPRPQGGGLRSCPPPPASRPTAPPLTSLRPPPCALGPPAMQATLHARHPWCRIRTDGVLCGVK